MKKSKQKVIVKRRNWDADFYTDLVNGDAFIITEPAEINLDGNRQKSLYGPQSPLYGTNYEDEDAFIERYRCQCGAFKSRQFEGEICPICNTKVEYRGANINITGWITLGNNRIINPYYYRLFQKAIGNKIFPEIIFAKYKITTDGKRQRPNSEDLDTEPLSPFSGIGFDEFFFRYEEVIDYFIEVSKKKNNYKKVKMLENLYKEKRKVFTSHIPIPSTMLRPSSSTADTFYFTSVDKLINTTFNLSESLKRCIDVERDYILHRIQGKVNDMWDIYFEELNHKEGHIRGEMLGGSLNYTSRKFLRIYCSDIID